MKVSVIVPIYKAKKYIERCVRSLMEQTMEEGIEFIFINDCTPDNSMEILNNITNEYSNRSEQVKIINNEINLGPSETRKKGFLAASGEYIACCDADDCVEPEMYETMYKATKDEEFDIIVCNYRVEENEKSRNCYINPSSTPQEALAMLHECSYFPYAMWNQLIRKKYILEQIKHVTPVNIREDTFLLMRIYYHAKSISYIKGTYYHYHQDNETSLIHSYDDSYKAWLLQKRNMDDITEMLYSVDDGCKKYSYAMNNFKYARKQDYRNAFNSLKEFYNEYRETHSDYVICDGQKHSSALTKFKLKMIYDTNYFIFSLYNKYRR